MHKIFVMRKIIFILLFLIFTSQPSLMAQEKCDEIQSSKDTAEIKNLSSQAAVIAAKISDDNESILSSATTYLSAIGESTNFIDSEINFFISGLTPICKDTKLDAQFRSNVCTRLSGLHGKLVQKLESKGISDGKSAYQYLKLSLSLDPRNIDAIMGHANTVAEIYGYGFIVRKMVELNLSTNFKDEAKYAKENLERINQTSTPIYKRIMDIL